MIIFFHILVRVGQEILEIFLGKNRSKTERGSLELAVPPSKTTVEVIKMADYDSYDSDEFEVSGAVSFSTQSYNHPSTSDYFGGTAKNSKNEPKVNPFSGQGIGRGTPWGMNVNVGVTKPASDRGRGFKTQYVGRGHRGTDNNDFNLSAYGGHHAQRYDHGGASTSTCRGRGQYSGRGHDNVYRNQGQSSAQNDRGGASRGRGVRGRTDIEKLGGEKSPEQWISEIKWAAAQKEKSGLSSLLRECFSSTSIPYMFVLYLIEACPDYGNPKTTSLCFLILKEFADWINTNENKAKYYKLLNENIRLEAFEMGSHGNMLLFDNTVKAYSLCHNGNTYFLPFIKSMLLYHRYKEASSCVSRLDLHDHFETKDIILPLLFQDKVNILENYVFRKKKEQERLVQLLDMLCEKGFSIVEFSRQFDIPDIRLDKLKYKTLSKLAVRLLKLYKIKAETCPNINNAKAMGGIRFIMYKKYTEKTISDEVWEELVESSIGDNVTLQEQFVDGLVDYLDMEEAAKWAIKYKLPDDKVPDQIRQAMANYTEPGLQASLPAPDGDEDWDAECISEDAVKASYYHTLEFPREKIQWIDDKPGFERCLDKITVTGVTVGIDSEWRPTFGQMETRVSLIQLATEEEIFLLDAVRLYKCLTDEDWQKWADRFFCNAHVIKLGYGITSDLQMIVKALPCIKENMAGLVRVVDLQTLSQSILKIFPEFFVPDRTPTYVFDVDDNGDIEPHAVNTDKNQNTSIKRQKLKYSDLKKQQKNRGMDDDDEDDSDEESTGAGATGSFKKGEEKGLSDVVRMCCGKPLDKTQQMSNWEKRPLREAQIIYASLDAFVLLEVYDVIRSIAAKKSLDINMEPRISMKWLKDKKSKREKIQEKKQQNVAELTAKEIERKKNERRQAREKLSEPLTPIFRDPITPQDFHVVVDNMLQGLGKQLRCCGCDVLILENHDDHDRAGVIGARENRIILTSGAPYLTLRSAVPEGYCMNVPNTMDAKEQVVEVLDMFNVKVTQKDIFSRCQICNGNQYAYIKQEEMKAAWLRRRTDDPTTERFHCPLSELKISGQINFSTMTIGTGQVPLQLDSLPEAVIDAIDLFFCCLSCGKIYWEGSHFKKVCEQFSRILKT
ncbi:exonuclease mut-7 homolog [Lineus longissimus]|uniref:exonuclease mut-7 homolog n=1 Tax=Lineus longissimus TaxID=88925 RepID=UPI00315D190F